MNLLEATRRMQRSRELALFYRRWAAAESAGLPIREILQGLAEGAPPHIRARAQHLIEALEREADLLESMEPTFTAPERGFLKVGLATGRLVEALEALETLFEADWRVARKVSSKVMYPFFLALCACWILPLPLVFWVGVWAWFASAIPASLAVFAFGGALVFGTFTWLRGRPKWAQARFLRALSTAMEAGLYFDEALELSVLVATPSQLAERLKKEDPAGRGLADILRSTGSFSGATVAMIESGELTGALASTLRKVADYVESETL